MLLVAPLLGACVPFGADQGDQKSDSPASADTSSALTYNPQGGAEGNKELFDSVNKRLFVGSAANPAPQEVFQALVDAGFDGLQIQVTSNVTTLKRDAYSMSDSVRIDGRCLVGQFVRAGESYSSTIVDPINSTGDCLVGDTTIDRSAVTSRSAAATTGGTPSTSSSPLAGP